MLNIKLYFYYKNEKNRNNKIIKTLNIAKRAIMKMINLIIF